MSDNAVARQYKVLIGSAALEDMRTIKRYIANQLAEPNSARRTIERVLDAIDALATMPARNRVVGVTVDGLEIRRARSGNYAILYFIDGDIVRIVSVAYGSRDLRNVIASIAL